MKLTERFQKALLYAAQLHADQERKVSGIPYVAHLLGITAIALEYGATEDEAIAALLHDAIEDQGGLATLQDIDRRFGSAVAGIVLGCTDADVTPKPPWRRRKEAYLASLATAPTGVRLVSAADKLDNARSILKDLRKLGDEVWARFNGGRDGTLWYYRAVTEALRSADSDSQLVDELDRTVRQIETLAATSQMIE